ncbi:hypothetical protein GCM10023318_10550 [Nocardia callitridis]|uniref:Uncharacterized protein n=1 Tax=Nocardia callitridis TaxID=648753 RepID=A0ABP9JZ43_9NOCA
MTVVFGVSVAVVEVVDVVAVFNGIVATVGAVDVRMVGMFDVFGWLALVVVIFVFAVQMPVVGVVDVVAVLNGHVTAIRSVHMIVTGVLLMRCSHLTSLFLDIGQVKRDD